MRSTDFRSIEITLRAGSGSALEGLVGELEGQSGVDSAKLSGDPRAKGLEPVTIGLLVAGTVFGVGLLARLADWVRDRNRCLVVIDGTKDPLSVKEDCTVEALKGKVILRTGKGDQLRVDKLGEVVDLEELTSTALDSSIKQALDLLKSKGGSGEIEKR